MNWKPIAVVAVLLAAVVGYVLYSSSTSDREFEAVEGPAEERTEQPAEESDKGPSKGESQPESAAAVEDEAPPAPEPTSERDAGDQPEVIEPPQRLQGSDERVQKAASDLHQKLPDWLDAEQQLRKWSVMVDQLAEGRLPTKHRPVTFRPDPFLVIEDGDKYYQDSGNYDRWDPLINAVTSIDPEKLAAYYHQWLPLLERAYGELGKEGSFDGRFRRMIHEMLEVGPVPENAALVRPHVYYEYADPELENASPLTKWMWRLGSENKQKVQQFLREFDNALLE